MRRHSGRPSSPLPRRLSTSGTDQPDQEKIGHHKSNNGRHIATIRIGARYVPVKISAMRRRADQSSHGRQIAPARHSFHRYIPSTVRAGCDARDSWDGPLPRSAAKARNIPLPAYHTGRSPPVCGNSAGQVCGPYRACCVSILFSLKPRNRHQRSCKGGCWHHHCDMPSFTSTVKVFADAAASRISAGG